MQYMYKSLVILIPLSEKDKNRNLIEIEGRLNCIISKVCDKIE